MHTPIWSLLDRPWLPVCRVSGVRELVRPSDLTAKIKDDPIIRFDWRRADFDAAAREFMINLLATTCWQQVVDEDGWHAWWHDPPDAEALEARFVPFQPAFELDGDGPRFMQDLEDLKSEPVGIGALLIDSPGANALKRNTDFFVKRGRVTRLSRAAAAMMLFTLQTFAPAGGAGNRTSLRGGGPLTTLALPPGASRDQPPTLWHLLWTNVFWSTHWDDPSIALTGLFPWLAPTRLSNAGESTTPDDVHPAQAFWGMPRRIRLDFVSNTDCSPCDLSGEIDEAIVRSFRTRPHGHDYQGWSRAHPLSPYYRQKPSDPEWLPMHPQPGRLGYRDWVALVFGDDGDAGKALRAPAAVIPVARARLRDLRLPERPRLLASGFDMDNMKARGFVESQMPLHVFDDQVAAAAEQMIRTMVAAARNVDGALSYWVARALFGDEVPGSDKGERWVARERFWAETEGYFFRHLDELATRLGDGPADEAMRRDRSQALRQDWHGVLKRAALRIFDELVPLDDIEERAVGRLVMTRRNLMSMLNGYGAAGKELFKALSLSLPESKQIKGRKAA